MNNGCSKTLSGPMSGLTCTAATLNLETDVAFGLEPEPGVDRAWRQPAQHLVAHAVELRRCDGEVASVERNGFVRSVSEGVCPRALAEPEADLPAPPDATAAGDQGLRAVPRVAGELAKFEQSIGLHVRQRLSPGE